MEHIGSGGFGPQLVTTSLGITEEAEFLASEHRMVKRSGITLDFATIPLSGSDRPLVKGTALAKITASGKYGPYDAGALDGRQTPGEDDAGYLLESINAKNGDVICGMLLHGSVLDARTTGDDATFKTAVRHRITFQ